MSGRLNDTHDPSLMSWVESANRSGTDFPIQNLPFGVFRQVGTSGAYRVGVAIGDQVVDVGAAADRGAFSDSTRDAARACCDSTLNSFMALGQSASSALRSELSHALRVRSASRAKLEPSLVPQSQVQLGLPVRIGDYSDFYASIHHASTVGSLLRPGNPLLPNYKWIPIAYHGRASSIGVSGQRFRRPSGQIKGSEFPTPAFGPSRRLDYELELGVYVGPGNALGTPIPMAQAPSHVFGMCLLNDWSARDLQGWEYQPLGPFLAKNFATTVSPWIVTLEALAPFRTEWTRAPSDPQPLEYLQSAENRAAGAIDIQIEAWIQTSQMRSAGESPYRLSHTSFRHSYWTIFQMLAHHASGGCNLMPGDLLGTGTQSGPTRSEAGSLLEISMGGKDVIALPNGQTRSFLEDGDTIVLRAYCERQGFARIGFGECAGTVLPAV
jgi:fumarylacetoacetase